MSVAILANGSYIQVIYANSPETVDYTQYGIDNALIIDNTGIWRDRDGLGLHLQAKGAAKALLTAPVRAISKTSLWCEPSRATTDDKIVSAASCTTNAITPVLKVLDEEYWIKMVTLKLRSVYQRPNLIDNYHKAERRGRSAPLNMVITETGAAKAASKAYPKLEGKLTGNAIRVPTPNVSMAILNLNFEKEAGSKEAINDFLQSSALFSDLQHQIDFTSSTEIVSSDLVGARAASIVDSSATIVSGDRATLYVWYDNEFGYSCQVMRVAQDMAGIFAPSLPAK